MRSADVSLYHACEALTEVLVYFVVVFGPWAFGTTQGWSIWTINVVGYVLGVLLLLKLGLRHSKGFQAPRWDSPTTSPRGEGAARSGRSPFSRWLISALLALTAAILAYTLASALNARATYHPDQLSFEYHSYLTWIPHSFDRQKSWAAFWTYLGLAGIFWSVRDWLLGKSASEQLAVWQQPATFVHSPSWPVPARFRRLFWVLSVNGALLAVEGIIQRLADCPRLLFLVLPTIHQTADTQFGPFAYRANAAQYFNLAWPVCLGFWWTLNRVASPQRRTHHWLLPCGALMASCPLISTSRGGALITLGIMASAGIFFCVSHCWPASTSRAKLAGPTDGCRVVAVFFVVVLFIGLSLGWRGLEPRLSRFGEGLSEREQIYEVARRMATEYSVFGVGPGAYESVSQLYRPSPEVFWPAQVHNDWLELRVTFGWVGSSLVYAALATVLLRRFTRGGIHGGRHFMMLLWLAVAGCLVHARFDFPFQVHSVLCLFVILCAAVFNLTRRV